MLETRQRQPHTRCFIGIGTILGKQTILFPLVVLSDQSPDYNLLNFLLHPNFTIIHSSDVTIYVMHKHTLKLEVIVESADSVGQEMPIRQVGAL